MPQSNPANTQAESFKALVKSLREAIHGPEQFTLSYGAESSAFVRFNHGKVRQAGQVQQASIGLKLINEGRHADLEITLSGDTQGDQQRLAEGLQQLREIEARVRGTQTLELSGCGHSPHRDQPEQLTSAIAGFLNNVR